MTASDYIVEKYKLVIGRHFPCKISATRHGGLTRLFAELGYKVGAEVGVEQGKFSEEICKDNPGVKLYCVDPWQAYTRYADHVDQAKLDRYFVEAVDRLAPYGVIIKRMTSLEAAKDFETNSLDFVYIDGNHEYQFVVNDICEWMRVVRPGGILAGHDYRRDKAERIPFHVIQAVQGYADAYHIAPWFILTKDKADTWLWEKKSA